MGAQSLELNSLRATDVETGNGCTDNRKDELERDENTSNGPCESAFLTFNDCVAHFINEVRLDAGQEPTEEQ